MTTRKTLMTAVLFATISCLFLVCTPAFAAGETSDDTRSLGIFLGIGVVILSAVIMTLTNRYFKNKRKREAQRKRKAKKRRR